MNKQNLDHVAMNTGGHIVNQRRTQQDVRVPQKATGDIKPEPQPAPEPEVAKTEEEDDDRLRGFAKASPDFKTIDSKDETPSKEEQSKTIAENTIE